MQNRLTLLGSTGSIGDSTLDVVARHPERFSVYALTAHRNGDKLVEQCLRFAPEVAVVGDAETAAHVDAKLRAAGSKTTVLYGPQALVDVSKSDGCDTVVAAIVGAAGMAPSLAAARAGKRILLANKEALVMSGAIFMDAVRDHGAILLPVDSEHNAIFQCMPRDAAEHGGISKIILTASGGPFRTREPATLVDVTPDEACKHPNWVMGRKISVDSATMMNKGLEVIEAHWLFGVPADRIAVVVHPQSIVHSMVELTDGSTIAQLGVTDMRLPIQYAFSYPERWQAPLPALDLARAVTLEFMAPDVERFPCLALAYRALRQGGTAMVALNAANEIAVDAFLTGRLAFPAIARIIDATLAAHDVQRADTLEAVRESDRRARAHAAHLASSLELKV